MRFLLLGTAACHLCEEAEEVLQTVSQSLALEFLVIDIAEQLELQPRFAIKIPVLYHEATASALCWPFSPTDVIHFIAELNHE